MSKYIFLMIIFTATTILMSETLFQVKDSSDRVVLDVSTDGLRVMNQGDTLMVISTEGIKAFIQKDTGKGLSRSFSVTTNSSKGEKAQGKVFEIATDQGATFYNPSDNSDEIFSISKGSIVANVNPSVNRDFTVNDQASANKAGGGNLMRISNEDVFEVVNDSTMLWYKQKNAFRVGHVLITDPLQVGQASFASGYQSQASGNYSSAIGYKSLASGTNSFSSGNASEASGSNSCAIGYRSEASGGSSYALGYLAKATGPSSFSFGLGCTASGQNSLAMGLLWTEASAQSSTAIGFGSKAIAPFSTSIGHGTNASGEFSTAMGVNTTSQAYNSFVVGKFNILSGSTTEWVDTDPLFVVGNGSADYSRSNAFTVFKNGSMAVSGDVYVKGDEAIWSDGNYFRWGNGGIGNYFPDKVGIGVSVPERKLHVVETAAVPAALIQNTGGTDAYFALQSGNTSNVNRWDFVSTTDGGFRILDKNANLSRFRIYSDGSIYFPSVYSTAGSTGKYVKIDSGGKLYASDTKETDGFSVDGEIELIKEENRALKSELDEIKKELKELREMITTK